MLQLDYLLLGSIKQNNIRISTDIAFNELHLSELVQIGKNLQVRFISLGSGAKRNIVLHRKGYSKNF